MKKRVLFYAVNGLGLGHLTRLLAIARQMMVLDPDVQPIFFTSSEACHVLHKHGIPYFKVPSKNLAKVGAMSIANLEAMYQHTMLGLLNTYRPAMMVVDTFPTGSLNDLVGVLATRRRMKKVFVHREMRPEKMTAERIVMQSFYDLVVAPHIEGTAKIPVPDERKLFWAGNIMVRERSELLDRLEARRVLGVPANKQVLLLSLGGGGDKTTQDDYRRILRILSERRDIHVVLTKDLLRTFSLDVDSSQVTVVHHYPLMELMNGFDVAISAAGYNTFHELMHCGVPTVFVPKMRGYDDQHKRAESAEHAGAGLVLVPSWIEQGLESRVQRLLASRASFSEAAMRLVPENGARLAAARMLQGL